LKANGVITFITDFGATDWYAGAIKGVVLGINPGACIVDICQNIRRGDVIAAAFALKNSYRFFPKGTVHAVIVDPGVGSRRRILLARSEGYFFLAPDNGVLDFVLGERARKSARTLQNHRYWLKTVSNTFHGRDIFAPVAAHLSLGVAPERFGPPCESRARLAYPFPRKRGSRALEGEVIYVDTFGNLVTNIEEGSLRGDTVIISIGGKRINGVKNSYMDVPDGELLAIYGSSGYLEISVNGGSAAEELGVTRGTKLLVERV
jgi:S-adenosylmethionine hydrolase